MSLKPEVQISFARGEQDSAAATAYKLDECRLLQNFRVTTDGRAQLRLGSVRTHQTALNSGAQGYGATQFTLADGTKQWVVFVGDSMLWSTDYGFSWTEETSSLREDYWSTATMRIATTNYLLSANGGTNSYDYDGTTWGTISNIPSGIKFLAVMNDRLWASDGNSLYASKVADYDTWASASGGISLTMNTHEGDDPITGLFSSSIGLLVFKRKSTAYVQGYSNSDVITRSGPQSLFRNVGCVAFRSIQGTGDGGVTWLSERGMEYWAPGMSLPILISAQVQTFFKNLAWKSIQTAPGLPSAVFSPRFLSVECSLPSSGVQNNITFVYRLPFGDKPGAPSRFTSSTTVSEFAYTLEADANGYLDLQLDDSQFRGKADANGYLDLAQSNEVGQYVTPDDNGYLDFDTRTQNASVLFLVDTAAQSNVVASVGYDGFVRVHDEGDLDDIAFDGTGGTEIDGVLKCRPFIFGDPFMRKHAQIMRVLAAHDEDTTVSVLVETDSGTTSEHELSISAGLDHPRVAKQHLGKRGWDLGPELRTSAAGLLVSGVRLSAKDMEEDDR